MRSRPILGRKTGGKKKVWEGDTEGTRGREAAPRTAKERSAIRE